MTAGESENIRPAAPRSIRSAVGVWAACAAFTVFHLGYVLIGLERTRRMLFGRGLNPDLVATVLRVEVVGSAVSAVVFGGLIGLFAWRLRAGKVWAAVGVTVVGALFALASLGNGDAGLSVVVLLLVGVALVYTWLPSSRHWLSDPRPPGPD
jgi:hypothetical protein